MGDQGRALFLLTLTTALGLTRWSREVRGAAGVVPRGAEMGQRQHPPTRSGRRRRRAREDRGLVQDQRLPVPRYPDHNVVLDGRSGRRSARRSSRCIPITTPSWSEVRRGVRRNPREGRREGDEAQDARRAPQDLRGDRQVPVHPGRGDQRQVPGEGPGKAGQQADPPRLDQPRPPHSSSGGRLGPRHSRADGRGGGGGGEEVRQAGAGPPEPPGTSAGA